jgi:DNA-binding LacI/PurR family transcriptional regulator/DNA-binding response OmpR family regulator/nitrogen-specific signal transduction histidine kinase
MHNQIKRKPTIGFISTWPVYQGTTIDRYAHSLIQGISAAASEQGCTLLLGCGFSVTGNSPQNRSFWPVPGPNINFVPVGPWNTDGLIIVPDELTEEQSQYVRDLLVSGFPVIFTTPEGPGPVAAVDNTLGIKQAFEHLLQHGHRQIAFIAGNLGHGGDSEERLQAYRVAIKDAGLFEDPRLITFGEHRQDGGRLAMQQILDSGAPFTALIASNDLSCLGAIQCLKEAGRRIPEDVAVIGFDDILDARSLSPSLTTIRHPTFSLGHQSVITLLDHIRGSASRKSRVVVPPRLIIRQSCGCPPTGTGLSLPNSLEPALQLNDLSRAMAEASLIEARNSLLEDLAEQCSSFLEAFLGSLKLQDANFIMREVKRVLAWTDERDEDPHIWQAGMAILYQKMSTFLDLVPYTSQAFITSLIDRVHLEISDQIQRRTTRSMIEHMDMMSQLGLMTAELLTAMNVSESADILTRHLSKVGIKNLLVALYDNTGEDYTAQGTVLFTAGLSGMGNGQRFETRKFPIREIYPEDNAIQLTILPLNVDNKTFGFVAFDAPNPELCAAIVHNLGAVLRTSQLYNDAIEGRRLAEDANRLKSRFLSMVSHELRTPLSLIIGLSEMVLREQQDSEGHTQPKLRDLEQINISAQHLARLIGDVLDLASSEAGQLHILREPLDLSDVLQVATKIGEELAHEKRLAWSVHLPPRSPWVVGDRTRLRQIALNLISNAVKFTPAGQVQFDVKIDTKDVVISVSDTGIGISPAEQGTIFDEFYRSQDAVQSGYGGMGLGLAITKQLIEHHGGTIEIHSPGDLGSGSTFSFRLPIISETTLQMELPSHLTKTNNLVIILAESNDSTSQLAEYLKIRGFDIRVCHVDEDSDWLSKMAQVSPSAIILEEHLAVREGWAITGMLKRQIATEGIPVLAYSLNSENNHGQILELNYLHKPLKLDQLSKELEYFSTLRDKPQTILIVDDDPGILDLHSRLVAQTGRRVVTARNGSEALALVEQQTPDLILLDLMMPEMDGFAVLDELRARESTRDIPVIILTARLLSDADLERCNRGVATILGKGLFSAEETLGHVEAALTRQHTLNRATQQLIRKAMAYIHTRYSEPITREEIADHIGISADYLTDCFRQELGITPITYIRRYRIRQACELLRNSDQSITQVALMVGFSDSAHFTRTFQREVGSTPRAFRSNK